MTTTDHLPPELVKAVMRLAEYHSALQVEVNTTPDDEDGFADAVSRRNAAYDALRNAVEALAARLPTEAEIAAMWRLTAEAAWKLPDRSGDVAAIRALIERSQP